MSAIAITNNANATPHLLSCAPLTANPNPPPFSLIFLDWSHKLTKHNGRHDDDQSAHRKRSKTKKREDFRVAACLIPVSYFDSISPAQLSSAQLSSAQLSLAQLSSAQPIVQGSAALLLRRSPKPNQKQNLRIQINLNTHGRTGTIAGGAHIAPPLAHVLFFSLNNGGLST
jgi:hypothetical protein